MCRFKIKLSVTITYYSIEINIYKMQIQAVFSQQAIDQLFGSAYFIDKFQQLQIQTYNDLMQVQLLKQSQNGQSSNSATDKTGTVATPKTPKIIQVDQLCSQIGDLLIKNFKQAMFKQSNSFYEQKLNLINITEEIQTLKQSINKMGQTTSFVISGKTATTQESVTPDKCELKEALKQAANSGGKHDNRNEEASMFMYEQEQSSIELGASRKNLAQDRIGSFSFMNSFLNENKISPQEEEIINQRINASISKIQSSIDDRISQLQKEFTRRIEQVMKTIKHLIQMMSQYELIDHQSPFGKSNKKDTYNNIEQQKLQNKLKKVPQNTSKNLTSKSTVILPQTKIIQKQTKTVQKRDDVQGIDVKKFAAIPYQTQHKQIKVNKSSSKLAAFFGIGRLNTSQK